MTTAARPVSDPIVQPYGGTRTTGSVGTLLDRVAALIGRMWRQLAAIASAGQLGPDPETEIGRATGARV